MGIAGDMLCHIQGAEKMRKRMPGTMTNDPVAIFTGLCLVFCNRPPMQKYVLPWKYSWLRPSSVLVSCVGGAVAFLPVGESWGDEATESSFSPPCISRLPLPDSVLGMRKLDRSERGVRMGVGTFGPAL